MNTCDISKNWVKDALRRNDGKLKLIGVAKDIWAHHEMELKNSDDLFFLGNMTCVGPLPRFERLAN